MQNLLKKVDRRYKVGFLAALTVGLLAHAMALVNKYSFHDDVGCLFSAGATFSSGRWMLGYLHALEKAFYGSCSISIPMVNGLLSLLCIAISACLIIYLLELKSTPACIGVGGILAAFPVVCGTFGYMFTAHYYMLGYLMGIAGTVLVCRGTKWYLLPVALVLQTCAVGVYQATIPVMLSLMVLWVFARCWDNEIGWLQFWRDILRLLADCVAFMVLYFVINKLCLTVHRVALNSYLGISSMGSESVGTYFSRALLAVKLFFSPSVGDSAEIYLFRLRELYWFILLFAGMGIVLKAVKLGFSRGLRLLLPALVLPLAVNFIYVMCSQADAHTLTLYGQVGTLILLGFLADRLELRPLRVAGAAALLVCLVMFVRLDNALYLKAEFEQTRTIQYYTAMVAQIKSADGYEDDLPVALVGLGNNQDSTVQNIEQLDAIRVIPYYGEKTLVNNYRVTTFISRWCGFSPQYADPEPFATLPEVSQMPCYPDDGSIQVIDGTVVVKISE